MPALLAPFLGACLFFRRDDWQQQVGRFSTGEMQGGGAAKNRGRPVFRFVVQERTAAGQLVLEVR
jgi:hypothetical protein